MNIMAGRWGKLYRDSTPAELAMECAIAELGVPYRNQFPGYLFGFRYFPDFLLPTLKVIVEVDDSSHNKKDKIIADDNRTSELNAMGWTVVRCTNQEALDDARAVLRRLLKSARIDLSHPVSSLELGLPPKADRQRKKTLGEIRQLRLVAQSRKTNQPAPLHKSSTPRVSVPVPPVAELN